MSAATKPNPQKNALKIRLAESVVFLRAGDATGRQRTIQADAPPGMVRGLLVLTLAKPTRITSIEVELAGNTITAWPEGVGARRIEITEEHTVHSQSYVFFRADHSPGTTTRRHLSVGPGLSLDHEEEDHSEQSSLQHAGRTEDDREQPRVPYGAVPRPPRRHMSVDQTHFQRSFVAHRENAHPPPVTPPYSPTYSTDELFAHHSPAASISRRSPFAAYEASAAASVDDVRRALDAEQDFSGFGRSRSRVGRSSSRIWSPREVPNSRRVSLDEDREFQAGTSTSHLQHHAPPRRAERDGQTRSRLRDTEDDHLRGRKNKRFSFASALIEAMKDRVRSRSPLVEKDPGLSGYVTPPRGRTRDRTLMQPGEPSGIAHTEMSGLSRVNEVLGPETEEGREHGDGWKEFRKGVYTYPISFAIPANAPPSLQVEYGSVNWKLKAVVHRPGTFTTKLTASQGITVVITPDEDDTEETESIIVERQWDTQMQYLILISGRSFTIGGTLPLSITFMPWTKMKIHRISVLIEERVDYWTGFRRVARTDPVNRISLLALKHPKKDGPHLLPHVPDDPDAFRRSPLSTIVNPDDDIGEVASSFMGPGPWTIRQELHLPKSGNLLHITNKNRRSNISVSHMLKLIFRVERGDDDVLDPQTGKRKLFDIVVQTPVHILSHLCNPEHTSLPPYSTLPHPLTSPSSGQAPMNATVGSHPNGHLDALPPHQPAPITSSDTSISASILTPQPSSTSTTNLLPRRRHPPGTSEPSIDHPPYTEAHTGSNTPIASPPRSRRQSFLDHTTSELFERLITGQESEEGEAPPAYETVLDTPPVVMSPSHAAVHHS